MSAKNNKQPNKFSAWLKSSSSDLWLFVIALILLNLVASRAFFRIDITGSKAYSLSKASKEVVKTIEEPLSVKVFFSSNLPAQYANTEQYLKDILVEYKNAANSNFSYEYFNMDKEENIKQAQAYGLQQVQIREVKTSEVGFKNAFMGLVITYADQIEKLDGIESSDGLEYKITTTIGKIISNTNALSGLSSTVKATLYCSEGITKLSVANANKVSSIVEKAFNEANKKFDGRLVFEKVSPSQEDSVLLAERFGIQNIEWRDRNGEKNNGALGLVIECNDSFRVINFPMQNMLIQYVIGGLDDVEEKIVENVQSLVSKTSTVAYITGHGELDLNDDKEGAAKFAQLCSDTYTLKSVNLAEEEIPSGVQTVIINGPKTAYTDAELYKLDQYLMRGGNLMFFMDPFEVIESQASQYQQYRQPPQYKPIRTGLEKLLSSYGIECGTNYIMDSACYSANDRQYGKMDYYFIPMLQKEGLNQKNAITKNLGYVLLLQTGSVDISKAAENKDVKATVLAKTSPKSWTLSQIMALHPAYIQVPESKSEMKSENAVVLLEGKFTSPYAADPSASENSDDSMSSKSHLSHSAQKGKIFLAGSSFITSPQLVTGNGSEPVEMLIRNAVDYMNGNEEICTMRTKNMSINVLKDAPVGLMLFAKYFNIVALPLIVAICGLCVWISRKKRRERIRMVYNPDDERIVSKKSAVKKEGK